MNKDLKPHEIEFNEAIRSVELAINSMKLNGVHAQDQQWADRSDGRTDTGRTPGH